MLSSVGDILDRLKRFLGLASDAALAEQLGAARNAPATWKRRGTIPLDELAALAEREHLSLHWVLTGQGSERLPQHAAVADAVSGEALTGEKVPKPEERHAGGEQGHGVQESDFESRLQRLKQITEFMQQIEQEDSIAIPHDKTADILELAYKASLDKNGIRRMLALLGLVPRKKGGTQQGVIEEGVIPKMDLRW